MAKYGMAHYSPECLNCERNVNIIKTFLFELLLGSSLLTLKVSLVSDDATLAGD